MSIPVNRRKILDKIGAISLRFTQGKWEHNLNRNSIFFPLSLYTALAKQ
jgi:hypothetical protein